MRPDPIWQALGIAPTTEVAAIRRAYAQRLKALDVDADPDAFMALREARDEALRHAAAGEAPVVQAVAPAPMSGEGATDRLSASGGAPVLGGRTGYDSGELIAAGPPAEDDRVDLILGAMATVRIGEATDRSDPIAAIVVGVPLLAGHEAVDGVGIPRQSAPPGLEADYNAFVALLFPPEEGPFPTPREQAQLGVHFEALLADPRLAELAFYADAERWFSEVLAKSIPLSDPILRRAAEFFGWLDRSGEISQTPAIAYVTDRLRAMDFLDAVQRKGHPFHKAWQELRRPAKEGSSRGWVRRGKVLELLALVRRDYPSLEGYFDWYRVSLWEDPPATSWGGSGIFVGGFLVLQLVMALARCSSPPPPSLPVDPPRQVENEFVSQDAEIGAALDSIFSGALTLQTIRARNTELYDILVVNWRVARDNRVSGQAFVKAVDTLLLDRAFRARARLKGALLLEQRRLDLDVAQVLKRRDADLCNQYFRYGTAPAEFVPSNLRDRQKALLIRLLMEVDGSPPKSGEPAREGYTISGEMVDAVAERAGMDRDTLITALDGGGSASQQCSAKIALLGVALMRSGGEGLPVLRNM
ncbi:hypothetical protein [Sphingomonas colocasiae]|uniref:J domain-containing protein n=1 Tax=Sphingomonas colocasiae TaxID=1848973 RepID=A0ABS7PK99_9SPHN|nr:hypothetical protein [Sphingomonas colocasiae]MBY8821725.1 hypothetical protein [Sphingomonas colocasiae]